MQWLTARVADEPTLELGYLYFFNLIPLFLFSPWSGVPADRYRRRDRRRRDRGSVPGERGDGRAQGAARGRWASSPPCCRCWAWACCCGIDDAPDRRCRGRRRERGGRRGGSLYPEFPNGDTSRRGVRAAHSGDPGPSTKGGRPCRAVILQMEA
ncbi:hypothetical protein GCM10009609_33250 [Pseudonocardia aurantiaca]